MSGPASGVPARKPALLIHHPLPGQLRVTKVRNAPDDPGRPGISAQRRQLPVGHHPPARYLPDNRLHPFPEPRFSSLVHLLVLYATAPSQIPPTRLTLPCSPPPASAHSPRRLPHPSARR